MKSFLTIFSLWFEAFERFRLWNDPFLRFLKVELKATGASYDSFPRIGTKEEEDSLIVFFPSFTFDFQRGNVQTSSSCEFLSSFIYWCVSASSADGFSFLGVKRWISPQKAEEEDVRRKEGKIAHSVINGEKKKWKSPPTRRRFVAKLHTLFRIFSTHFFQRLIYFESMIKTMSGINYIFSLLRI